MSGPSKCHGLTDDEMFTTCIYCGSNLGKNESLEAFPVGRRIAFDPLLGRLWVVCRACERWNLSPLEERWEAVESAEIAFRACKLRVSTENIGLARLREGLELVRIGQPQRPEMAAWRYGDQFGRRRQRQLLITGGAIGGAAALLIGGAVAGISIGSFAGIASSSGMWDRMVYGSPRKLVANVNSGFGTTLRVERRHARMSALLQRDREAPFELRLEHLHGTDVLTGDVAMRAAAQILPAVNRFGGSKLSVIQAVTLLEESGGALKTLQRIQYRSGAKSRDLLPERQRNHIALSDIPGTLHQLPLRDRLALEMALHEEQERRAMTGELHELERAWREADEIAQIADTMFESPAVVDSLDRIKRNEVVQNGKAQS